jgi:hypothetical protein
LIFSPGKRAHGVDSLGSSDRDSLSASPENLDILQFREKPAKYYPAPIAPSTEFLAPNYFAQEKFLAPRSNPFESGSLFASYYQGPSTAAEEIRLPVFKSLSSFE